MTGSDDERILREAFQDLRRDTRERGAVPDAHAMLARARAAAEAATTPSAVTDPAPTSTWARRSGWLSLAAAAAVATLMFVDRAGHADREFERLVSAYSTDVTAGAWRSPTDALLRTPGVDLGAIPSFGSSMVGPGSRPDAPRPEAPREAGPGRDS